MSWILMLLKNLPAIMAAIQSLIAIFTAKAAFAAHQALSAVTASGVALSAEQADQWNTYVFGQGAGSVGLLVSAALFALGQSSNNKAFDALAERDELKAAFGEIGIAEIAAAHQARVLQARMALLPVSATK